MFSRATRHMRHNVVAYLALFVALGSTSAWAASGGITGTQVRDESLTGADVLNDSLTGSDIQESSLGKVPSAVSADSAPVSGYQRVITSQPAGDFDGEARCPEGKKAVGGGWSTLRTPGPPLHNNPSGDGGAWVVFLLTVPDTAWAVHAVCVDTLG